MFGNLNNKPQNPEKEIKKVFSYKELLSIREEIDEYNNGELGLKSLSEDAIYFRNSGKDINEEIEKKKTEGEKLEIISNLKIKKEKLEKEITDKQSIYSDLDKEFERLNSAPQSSGIAINMGKISDKLELLKKELQEIDDQLDMLDID